MPAPRTRDEIAALRAEVEKFVWFHHIDLGDGIETPGRDVATPEWKRWFMKFPADLHGWSVLDIGAWDGFFSFEAERRGASRVLAIDSFVWESGAPFQNGVVASSSAQASRMIDSPCRVWYNPTAGAHIVGHFRIPAPTGVLSLCPGRIGLPRGRIRVRRTPLPGHAAVHGR